VAITLPPRDPDEPEEIDQVIVLTVTPQRR